MQQWISWLILVVLLTIIELMTINLATIWFVISGIIALVISIFYDNYTIQFAVFVIGGVILLITTKPFLTKYLKTHKEKTNVDRIIGMTGKVTEKITKNENGAIKIDGKEWTAYSDHTINKDELAQVLEIKGVKVKVQKFKEDE